MSAPSFYGPSGAIFSIDAHVNVARWGGGADHGKYHVYLCGAGYDFFTFSRQAVVDDFGDLIAVETS
jgi:hypothetical protein